VACAEAVADAMAQLVWTTLLPPPAEEEAPEDAARTV
jgi:hypothetical protein